jgi:uncharacterized membrane-anchored protein YhcB (DUF1043 family)
MHGMDFSPYVAIIVGLALFSIGVMLGYVLALHLQRKSSGGKLASELKAELDNYRDQVTEHFSRTSELFQTLTEQYRTLYDHLAEGAQGLCSPEPETPALEIPDTGLLEVPGAVSGQSEPGEKTAERGRRSGV